MHSSALFFTLTCDNGDVMILLLFLEPNDESGANVDASVSCLYELHCLVAHVYLYMHDNVSPVCVCMCVAAENVERQSKTIQRYCTVISSKIIRTVACSNEYTP